MCGNCGDGCWLVLTPRRSTYPCNPYGGEPPYIVTGPTQAPRLPLETDTRDEWAAWILNHIPAEDAHERYVHFFKTHQNLLRLLHDHPANDLNHQATAARPAPGLNKVSMMWDYVCENFQFIIETLSPQDPSNSKGMREMMVRFVKEQYLFRDTEGWGPAEDPNVVFGDEIQALVDYLFDEPGVCQGCGQCWREDGRPLLICAKCKKDRYCSIKCQKSCYKKHKKVCVVPADEELANASREV